MSSDLKANLSGPGRSPARVAPKSQKPRLLQLPGLIAVSLYMLLLAFTVTLGVVNGHFPPVCIVFPVLFIAAGFGLLLLLRWAWALTLAAVAILAGLFLWNYTNQHLTASLVQGLINLIIFLYLVRAKIRNKLH